MFSPAPIALFVYNRPSHTRQTIEALRENELAPESDLFIFSDAPKNENAIAAVGEVREYVRRVDGFRSVSVVERDRNLGLANSIIDGVTRLCQESGRAIVLEDDLVTSPFFLRYMNEALERYREESRVMQISGYMFPVELDSAEDALFLPFMASWGWATWGRAWSLFDPSASAYEVLKKDWRLRRRFDLNGAYPYFRMLEMQLRGEVDSWAIRWYLSAFMKEGLALYPARTLVKNIGFDGSGVHCSTEIPSQQIGSSGVGGDEHLKRFPEVAVSPRPQQKIYKYLIDQQGLRARAAYLIRRRF